MSDTIHPDLRIRIALKGPLATPMISGSLFGHFCWLIRLHHGEDRLLQFLAALESQPLVFSDALPAGHAPVPTLAITAAPGPIQPNRKLLNKRHWLQLTAFLKARAKLNATALYTILQDTSDPKTLSSQRLAHNQINRHTGTTPETGGLYFTDEFWPTTDTSEFDIYVRGHHHGLDLPSLFSAMGEHGYGRDASTGRGRFQVVSSDLVPALLASPGNRWVSWSSGTHSPAISAARYRLFTHYGKLGALWSTQTVAPFKRPITLWRAGATFAAPSSQTITGQLLKNVHPRTPGIIHNAWHFAVPFNEVTS
jgi:CRISPR-associated protein Csm4